METGEQVASGKRVTTGRVLASVWKVEIGERVASGKRVTIGNSVASGEGLETDDSMAYICSIAREQKGGHVMPEKEGQRLRIITLLSILWGYYPEERIGQLLANTIGDEAEFYIIDDEFERRLIQEIENAKVEARPWASPV